MFGVSLGTSKRIHNDFFFPKGKVNLGWYFMARYTLLLNVRKVDNEHSINIDIMDIMWYCGQSNEEKKK